jgi:hypothetical protein
MFLASTVIVCLSRWACLVVAILTGVVMVLMGFGLVVSGGPNGMNPRAGSETPSI